MLKSLSYKTSIAILYLMICNIPAFGKMQGDHSYNPITLPPKKIQTSPVVIQNSIQARQAIETMYGYCPEGYTGNVVLTRYRTDYIYPPLPSQFSSWFQTANYCTILQ